MSPLLREVAYLLCCGHLSGCPDCSGECLGRAAKVPQAKQIIAALRSRATSDEMRGICDEALK